MEKIKNFLKPIFTLNFVFYILTIIGIFLLIFSIIVKEREIEIPYLGHINADLRMNMEVDYENAHKIHLMTLGKYEIDPYFWKTKNTYVSYDVNNFPLYSLSLRVDGENKDEVIKKINNIALFISHKMFYFTGEDILKFKKSKEGDYIFPSYVKYSKNSKYITDRGALRHIVYGGLSFFYNARLYIIPYLWLFMLVLIYALNKDKINLGFTFFKNSAIWWIVLIAFLIRICDAGHNFWSDELYVATCAGYPFGNFLDTFTDPGNPPLFFIFARYWMKFFGSGENICRMLVAIFSSVSVYLVYKFLEQNGARKCFSLLSAFILAINIYSIHTGQDFRTYSLAGLFSVLISIYLFKIIKNPKKSYFIIYALIVALMMNTHYFQALVIFGAFIWGMIFIKEKSNKLKFFISNFIGGLFFLPYFLMTSLNGALLNEKFNVLVKPDFAMMKGLFIEFFTSFHIALIVVLVSVVLLIPKCRDFLFKFEHNEEKTIFLYSIYTTLMLFISSYLFSQIRPVIKPFYYLNIIPFIGIIIAFVLLLPFKKKVFGILFSIIFFFLYFSGGEYFSKKGILSLNFNTIFEYMKFDSPKYREKGLKIGVGFHDRLEYKRYFEQYTKGDEEVVMYKVYDLIDNVFNEIKKSKSDVIYMRLEKNYSSFVERLKGYADVSFIRGDKDAIYARIIKK